MSRTGGEQRKRQLIAEAIGAFGRRGYEATTLDQVAEAAGVRKQSLLYYFPTKDALFDACVDALSARVAAALADALEGVDDENDFDSPPARIIHAIFQLAQEWPEFPGFIREASRRGSDVVTRFAGVMDPLRKRALHFLENGMSLGRFRRQDPALLLFTIYTAVVGSITEASVLRAVAGRAGGRAALRKREEELISFVRAALEP
jgi:TetR/AcrR family transcriptional regulator